MSEVYAIETPNRTAGIAVREPQGFRFFASDGDFTSLESELYPRLADLHRALKQHEQLTAVPSLPKGPPRRVNAARSPFVGLGRL